MLNKLCRAINKNLCIIQKKVLNKSCRGFYYLRNWCLLFLSYNARFTRYFIKRVFQDGGWSSKRPVPPTWLYIQGAPSNIFLHANQFCRRLHYEPTFFALAFGLSVILYILGLQMSYWPLFINMFIYLFKIEVHFNLE